jgi:hypothetical protein
LYFVIDSAYPEYYVVIKKPMDLGTLRERLSSFSTIEEFIASARLIWENCSEFNDPSADIVALANELADFLKDALVVTYTLAFIIIAL